MPPHTGLHMGHAATTGDLVRLGRMVSTMSAIPAASDGARGPTTPPLTPGAEGEPPAAGAKAPFLPADAASKFLNADDLPTSVLPTMRFDPAFNEPLSSRMGRRVVSCGDLASLSRRQSRVNLEALGGSPPRADGASADGSPPPAMSPSGSDASLFDATLLERWEDHLAEGRFRYDVTDCPTKTLEGRFRFIMQLNLGRASKKRQTEFSADNVVQSFDGSKFNFTKARQNEMVFSFQPTLPLHRTVMRKSPSMAEFSNAQTAEEAPNCVLINVSPIEYGHVLLVPRITDCLPQQITLDTLHLALHMAAESNNEHFRIGFNSLGAYATINHLHFQGYYLWQNFPVELAATAPMFKASGVTVARTVDYPVRVLVCSARDSGANLKELARVVSHMCEAFQATNTPFNLLITESGRCIYVIPQRFSRAIANGEVPQDVIDTGVNPAVFEIAGHMVLKRQEDYDQLDEPKTIRMLEQATLSEEDFGSIAARFQRDLA